MAGRPATSHDPFDELASEDGDEIGPQRAGSELTKAEPLFPTVASSEAKAKALTANSAKPSPPVAPSVEPMAAAKRPGGSRFGPTAKILAQPVGRAPRGPTPLHEFPPGPLGDGGLHVLLPLIFFPFFSHEAFHLTRHRRAQQRGIVEMRASSQGIGASSLRRFNHKHQREQERGKRQRDRVWSLRLRVYSMEIIFWQAAHDVVTSSKQVSIARLR